MSRVLTQTQAMFKQASQYIPRGVNSNFRYWGPEETLVITRGEGAYIWDADGKPLFQKTVAVLALYDFGYQGNVSTSGDSTLERIRLLHLLDRGEAWLGEADVRHLRSQYAGEVAFDERIGIMAGSILSGVTGYLLLRSVCKRPDEACH